MLDSEQLSHRCVQRKITHKVGTWQEQLLGWAGNVLRPDQRPARSVQSCSGSSSPLLRPRPRHFLFQGPSPPLPVTPTRLACLFSALPSGPYLATCSYVYLLEAYDWDIWGRVRGDSCDQPFINGGEILIIRTDARNWTLTQCRLRPSFRFWVAPKELHHSNITHVGEGPVSSLMMGPGRFSL